MKQIANWLLCTAIFASFMELWSFHDRLGTGVGDDGAALTLQRFELSAWNLVGWCTVPSRRLLYTMAMLVCFCASTGLQHFPWQAWIRSEGSWLILANVRKSHYSLEFGEMHHEADHYLKWPCIFWSRPAEGAVILWMSHCDMQICRMITYPNIVVSITIF